MAIRFDVIRFHAALDEVRRDVGLDWKTVAQRTGVPASTLTRMGKGKRPSADNLAALVWWANLDLLDYVQQP